MERTVTLQHPGCIYEGTIMHELLHALGTDNIYRRINIFCRLRRFSS